MSTRGDVGKQQSDGGSGSQVERELFDILSWIKARVVAVGSVSIDNGNEGKDWPSDYPAP